MKSGNDEVSVCRLFVPVPGAVVVVLGSLPAPVVVVVAFVMARSLLSHPVVYV